ncbi:MAG: alpha/beta hydrolase [Acidobacteria bacterium]|nr:MAG: alpha/beta hydrolase [Acidobacteriota bacterium]
MYDRPMDVFEPRASLRNAHRMTLYSWGNPRHFPRLPAPTRRYFDVAPATRVVADCHWHERPWEHVTLVALHGLNGSSEAHYMRGLAAKGFARGMNVVRLNQRNCGDTEHLAEGLFHSGLTADAAHVVHELTHIDGLPAIGVAGYSLGGNLALKLAGEYGAFAPKTVLGVAAVSPIIEISECTRALERPGNALYQWNFVRDLKRRMRRKERFHSGRFDLTKLNAVRTVREFDETYTAPYFGFRNAEDYYHRASSMRVIDRIRVPALIITAEDDPFVPSRPFHDPKVTGNPHIDLRVSPHGGHCGFVGARSGEDDGYWAENRIVEFIWGLGTGDGLPGTGTRHLLRVDTDSPRFQNVEGDPFRVVVRRG